MTKNQQVWDDLQAIKEKVLKYKETIHSLKAPNTDRTGEERELMKAVAALTDLVSGIHQSVTSLHEKTDLILAGQKDRKEHRQPKPSQPIQATPNGYSQIRGMVRSQSPKMPPHPPMPGQPKPKTTHYKTNIAVNKIERYETKKGTKQWKEEEPAPSYKADRPGKVEASPVITVGDKTITPPVEEIPTQSQSQHEQVPKKEEKTNTFLSLFQKKKKHGE